MPFSGLFCYHSLLQGNINEDEQQCYHKIFPQFFQTAKSYCACYTGDLDEVVARIKLRFPEAALMAAGTSLGG